MQFLKANTAIEVLIGPAVAVGDGYTPVTNLVGASADEYEIIKTNGTTTLTGAAITNALAALTSAVDGYYSLELTATETNTEGSLWVVIQDDSLILPIRQEFMVLAEAAYDSMFTAKDTGYMDVNVKAVSEDTVAADNLESACDNYSATRGLAGTALPAAVADAAGGLPISDAGGLAMDTLADWVNGGRLDLILDIIAADTTTDIPALIATAQADLDIITGAAGVVLDTDAITAAKIADDAITADQLAANAITEIWNHIIETVGSRTAQQAMSIMLAALAGVTTDSGATIKDSAGTNTRISATINGSNERTAMTLTPSS